jgi:dipeptidyl aminopeptidase/acylaminoacyl peptidase
MGQSYGGFMVLASLCFHPETWAAGVDLYGIANFVTLLERTSAYRRDQRRAEYGDERDPAMRQFLLRISPLTQAARITRPLLVAHGQNDPRVPVEQAEQIVKTVRQGGTPVWYLLAHDEGHGFRKRANRSRMARTLEAFLRKYLVD